MCVSKTVCGFLGMHVYQKKKKKKIHSFKKSPKVLTRAARHRAPSSVHAPATTPPSHTPCTALQVCVRQLQCAVPPSRFNWAGSVPQNSGLHPSTGTRFSKLRRDSGCFGHCAWEWRGGGGVRPGFVLCACGPAYAGLGGRWLSACQFRGGLRRAASCSKPGVIPPRLHHGIPLRCACGAWLKAVSARLQPRACSMWGGAGL